MSLLSEFIPTAWLENLFEAAAIIHEALEDVDWTEVLSAVVKLRDLSGLSEEDAIDALAEDIADDLDDAIDWAATFPGFLGSALEAKDHDGWKALVKLEAKRQAKRAARKARTGKSPRNVKAYTERLRARVANAQAAAAAGRAGSRAGARRRK